MGGRTLGAFHPVEKHAHYRGAELEYRGERWAGELREIQSVESDHRDIARTTQAKLADGMEHAERNHVIAGEK